MQLLKSLIILIIGFVLLIKGADFFVEGSSAVAKRLRIPSMIIGMTIVAMGTSLPECAVSVTASLTGNNSLAISNAVGSNIFNLLVAAEDHMTTAITFSALIAVMFLGVSLQRYREPVAKRISVKCGKLWVAAEVFLFVLVGATVNIGYLSHLGIKAVVLIFGALLFRMAGVFVCLLGTDLKGKEKLFTMMAYTPKATVQAAIGGIPLALGFACGDVVLTVAVLAIVLTAPLGAFAIDSSYKKFLAKNK